MRKVKENKELSMVANVLPIHEQHLHIYIYDADNEKKEKVK
jgi:hypothetical protein